MMIASDKAPLPALSFAEVIATSDVTSGVVNILTGLKKELIPHLAGHMDVNAIDYADLDKTMKKTVQELCANNVKRFVNTGQELGDKYYADELNENHYQIQNFTELKTIWHTMGF
jgi:acyl-CoA reductase-like NAD-dependent aldehyde dehydrogenase